MKQRKNNIKLSFKNAKFDKYNILKTFSKIIVTKNGVRKEIKLFKKQQIAFEKLQDNKTNEILYGGGARGGKSWLGVLWIVINCILYPNSKYLIGRKQLSDLKVTTLITLYEILNLFGLEKDLDYRVNNQDKYIAFNNGSIIFYRDLQNNPTDPNFDRIGSLELTGCFIEESQEIVKKAIDVLRGRMSKLKEIDEDGKVIWKKIPKMFYSCNPGKNWIYSDFYSPYKKNELPKDKVFIPALVTDNPHIDKAYIDNLRKGDKITVERLLNGNFDYDDDPLLLFDFDNLQQIFLNKIKKEYGEKMYMSIDLSGKGKDKTVIIIWKGLEIIKIIEEEKTNWKLLLPKLEKLEKTYGIQRKNVVIDSDGLGENFIDFYEGHYRFKGGSSMIKKEDVDKDEERFETRYKNLRSQCFFTLSEVVIENEVFINDSFFKEEIITELSFIKEKVSETSDTNFKQVESKKLIKENLGHSPDFGDAIMMRMVYELDKNIGREFDITFG